MKLPRVSLWLVVVSAVAGLSAQQQPLAPAPLSASLEVKIINVDVTVTDGNGNHVTGLSRDDFQIFEDGQLKKITNFVAVESPGRLSRTDSGLPDSRPSQRRTLLLIDNNYLERRDRDVALSKLGAYVDRSPDTDAEWSVATIGQAFDVIQPFTGDRAVVHAAIAKVRKVASTSLRATEDDREILSDPFRRNRSATAGDFDETARFAGRERTTRNARSLTYMASGLRDSARATAVAEGRKVIVLLTGDIELNSSFSAFDRSSDREMQDTKTAIAKLIDHVIQEANAANVTVFVLNASSRNVSAPQHGIENQSFGAQNDLNTAAASDVSDANSTGNRISLGTGGTYLRTTEVGQALEAISRKSAQYYSIAYAPEHPDDRKYHRISVRAAKPGVHLLHRQGYVDLSPEERIEQLLRLRISALQPARDIPVALEVGAPVRSDTKPTLALVAAAPFKNLTILRSERGYVGRVHIYLSIFDQSGKNVGFHHMTQDVTVPIADYTRAMADAFRYHMNIRLDRGDFTIAVTMRDELSRQVGTAVQSIHL